ncbi:MAG TPA: 50S ribosomal protein L9 [Spirochaetota bacterium]|nr:50S ribosomal protein L9 [Spirochaetota bacterium]
MGNVKVILKKDVANLGEEGDIKSVKAGFARNFLYPRELAVDYSAKNKNVYEKQKETIEKRKLEKKENAKDLKARLEAAKISLSISAGDKGRLYGTVTTTLIHDEIVKLGFNIDRKKIELKEHIKVAGNYKFNVHIYQDVNATMDLAVIAKQDEKKEEDRGQRRKKRNFRHEDRNYDNDKNSEVKEDEKVEQTEE